MWSFLTITIVLIILVALGMIFYAIHSALVVNNSNPSLFLFLLQFSPTLSFILDSKKLFSFHTTLCFLFSILSFYFSSLWSFKDPKIEIFIMFISTLYATVVGYIGCKIEPTALAQLTSFALKYPHISIFIRSSLEMTMLKMLMWVEGKAEGVSDIPLAFSIGFFYLHCSGMVKLLILGRDLGLCEGILSIFVAVCSKSYSHGFWGSGFGAVATASIALSYKNFMWAECCTKCKIKSDSRDNPVRENPTKNEEDIEARGITNVELLEEQAAPNTPTSGGTLVQRRTSPNVKTTEEKEQPSASGRAMGGGIVNKRLSLG